MMINMEIALKVLRGGGLGSNMHLYEGVSSRVMISRVACCTYEGVSSLVMISRVACLDIVEMRCTKETCICEKRPMKETYVMGAE